MKVARILIVEDELIVATDLQSRLVALGYLAVGTAVNADQALAMSDRLRPDLVLMDIHLEGDHDGISTASQIRRDYQLPVVFLTAYSDDATLERAKVTEPFGYILKPFEDRELKTVIEMALYRFRAEEERRRMKIQLLQAQKMELVGRLAGGVAHDFNNMLQTILGNAALALEQVPVPSQLRDDLLEIQKAAQRSANLTRQLLAFARKQTISPKVLDLNDAIAGMLKMLHRLIGEHIQLEWRPGAAVWPIKIDPAQLDQIMANLAVNGRDAIQGVGQITIATHNRAADDLSALHHPDGILGDAVQLTITDTGSGMDAETLAHLFEPFYTTKDVGQGTGLGLATVYGIVQQNGGHISVESEPGRGTCFKICLPRTQEQPMPSPVAEPDTLPRGTETILLVEDEAQILQVARRILQQAGYTVLAAKTPAEALRLVDQYPGVIQLLVTDVVMPGMNGRELQERLAPRLPALRCLFISGYTSNEISHQGMLGDHCELLQKPFTQHALTLRVREILDASNGAGVAGSK
jgi:two-component system, cell cycle sensor histidine kinase and response regulator CckA